MLLRIAGRALKTWASAQRSGIRADNGKGSEYDEGQGSLVEHC
jgi:hypothetical protein